MKLTTLLFGDLADVFQDARLDQAESNAELAASNASHNRLQVARLVQAVEQRIREVEQENAILSMLLLGILKHLSQSQPEATQKIVDEVAAVLRSGTPPSCERLKQLLDLPARPRPPIRHATKPPMGRPRATQGPMSAGSAQNP